MREEEQKKRKSKSAHKSQVILSLFPLVSFIMNDSSQKCLICSSPNTALHLGMDVCRACANFFKRAQLTDCRYPCRQGDHKCTVGKTARPKCRGCRLDKCIALGMSYEKPKKTGTLMSGNLNSTTKESLLYRIAQEHGACVERRRDNEIKIIKKYELQRLPHHNQEIYLSTFDCAVSSFNITISENWELFQTVFPSMRVLPYDEQREFFRLCMPQFALAECFYRTKKMLGGIKKYLMCSLFMCTQIDDPEQWISQIEPNREELIESFRAHSKEQMGLIVPSFVKADICERELHALLPLLLCEADLHIQLTERFKSFLHKIRTKILEDLHHFYTEEMKLVDYSTRLGNLLTICHTLREGNALFQVYFRMQVTVFDIYATATKLQELFL